VTGSTTHAFHDANPELAGALTIIRVLSAALRDGATELPPGVPDARAAEERLAEGIPALTGERLLEWPGLMRHARAIADALSRADAGPAAGAARTAVDALARAEDRLDQEALTSAALSGAWNSVADVAIRLNLDEHALPTVLDFAARPALQAGAGALAEVLSAARWNRGHCPACGAAPVLSVLGGKEHERRLHCGRCGTAWLYPRIRCPACGERNHERLNHLHGVGEGEYRRVEVCETCRGYLKSLALLDSTDVGRLLELDLETAALDFMALDQGYTRQ
jgi:FdhE protein